MNEQTVALRICQQLDVGTEDLSDHVMERLAVARAAALAAVGQTRRHARGSSSPPSLWFRFAATVLPLLLLVAGAFVVGNIEQEQSVAELAEVDSALLTDDVPLVAYADHGFGVYINNTRR